MKRKLIHQCVLRSPVYDKNGIQTGNSIYVVWLPNDIDFKVGQWVTLKETDEPKRRWQVVQKCDGQPRKEIKQTWKSQDLKRDGNRKKISL